MSTFRTSLQQIWAQVHSPRGLYFPKTVATLLNLGISRYRIDYVTRTITTYTSLSNTTSTSPVFDVSAFPTEHKYEFGANDEAVMVGVVEYVAFLDGKKVMYVGQLGEVHTEWFPGAKPDGE
ncbi:hypothetical protein CC78DRAFT_614330 [Lojkania enalia]|uniref:Uncharacterized protein n=1 Tax=Lojkania enalia TaxID=147567 RepID=A0A9P4KEE9_9PLEO|nr:hypothetical protein CC78DRAFT_614330 [Didymosphaeria enalia]